MCQGLFWCDITTVIVVITCQVTQRVEATHQASCFFIRVSLLVTIDIWGRIILCSGRLSCAFRMFSSLSGLCSLDASRNPPSMCGQIYHNVWPKYQKYLLLLLNAYRVLLFNPSHIVWATLLLFPCDQAETWEMRMLDGLPKVIVYMIQDGECPNHKTKWSFRTHLCALLVNK